MLESSGLDDAPLQLRMCDQQEVMYKCSVFGSSLSLAAKRTPTLDICFGHICVDIWNVPALQACPALEPALVNKSYNLMQVMHAEVTMHEGIDIEALF